jgi:hypothetical protein
MITRYLIKKWLRRLIRSILASAVERLLLSALGLLTLVVVLTLLGLTLMYLLYSNQPGGSGEGRSPWSPTGAVTVGRPGGCGRSR